jgi:hypothetical protein
MTPSLQKISRHTPDILVVAGSLKWEDPVQMSLKKKLNPIFKLTRAKRAGSGSSRRATGWQMQSPEFKHQWCQKKKKACKCGT